MSYDPKGYWEDRASSWVNENFNTEADYEFIQEFLDKDWSVLELGCGEGRWEPFFKKYQGWDVSERLIDHCKAKHPNGDFLVAEIAGKITTSKDLIFTYTALEHVKPEVIKDVAFDPDQKLLFVEPHGPSGVEHCFQHDYPALFGVKPLKSNEYLTVYGRL